MKLTGGMNAPRKIERVEILCTYRMNGSSEKGKNLSISKNETQWLDNLFLYFTKSL